MKQNNFRGIAVAVVVFALGIIAVGFTGCDFLEDFVKMQVAEEPPTVVFSGDSEVVGDSVIDAIRAAVGKNEVILTWYGEPEEVSLSEDTDLGTGGLVLSTVNYKLHSKLGYIAWGHDRWDDDNDPTNEGLAGDEYLANSPATVVIDGKGRTIALTGTNTVLMPLITVGEGVILVLRNVTFKGMQNNQAPLIRVSDKGELIMQSGAHLTNNDNRRSTFPYCYGGGVRVETGGMFTMGDGATISDNKANASSGRGGGVAVYGGTFTMKGGIISENSATYGGGVNVQSNGTFIMEGGFIEHNAANDGGGVHVGTAKFTKTGGTIYGITQENGEVEDSGKMNTNTHPDPDVPLRYGPAVCLSDSSVQKRRGTTAGPTVDLHYPLQDEDGKDLPNNWEDPQ